MPRKPPSFHHFVGHSELVARLRRQLEGAKAHAEHFHTDVLPVRQEIRMNQMSITTKKAAREAGYRTREQWLCAERDFNGQPRRPMVPKHEAEPTIIKGAAFYAVDQCDELISKTEAKRRGRKVPDTVQPIKYQHTHAHGKSRWYPLYRLSNCILGRRSIPPREVDLLEAIFRVNHSLKRYEAAESKHSENGEDLAAEAAETKAGKLQKLKRIGIIAAYRAGRLRCLGWHRKVAVYGGEGYLFHALIVPELLARAVPLESTSYMFVPAVPREAPRVRLKDAVHTLEGLQVTVEGFTRVDRRAVDAPVSRRYWLLEMPPDPGTDAEEIAPMDEALPL